MTNRYNRSRLAAGPLQLALAAVAALAARWCTGVSPSRTAGPPAEVLDWSNPPFARWFSDGKLNVAYNCVDRHVEAGRGDDVMNVSGHRLSTAEIELALVSHPAVAEAVVAFVILRASARDSGDMPAVLRQHVAKEVGDATTLADGSVMDLIAARIRPQDGDD